MKKFLIVFKDSLTESNLPRGAIFANNKRELIDRWHLSKGKNIPRLEYYLYPNFPDVLIFIHEILEVEITSEFQLQEDLMEFRRSNY